MSTVTPEDFGSARSRRRVARRVGRLEHRLRDRHQLGEDLDLFVHARPAAEEHVDDFLEIEQPERQLQVLRRERLRAVVEAVAVFVVRIDQEHAQVRPRVEDLPQQQRDAARLADAGGAEHREVLAHHVVDIDVGGDRGVLLQRADVDRAGAGHVEDQPQLALRDHLDGVADHRIFGDAALEEVAALARA